MHFHVTRMKITNRARTDKISSVLTFRDAFSYELLTSNMISHAIWRERENIPFA